MKTFLGRKRHIAGQTGAPVSYKISVWLETGLFECVVIINRNAGFSNSGLRSQQLFSENPFHRIPYLSQIFGHINTLQIQIRQQRIPESMGNSVDPDQTAP